MSSRDSISHKKWLAGVFDLDAQLSAWITSLPTSLRYSKRSLYDQLVVQHQPVYVFMYGIYYQCRLVLHAALVPQFSGLSPTTTIPVEMVSASARIALNNARSLTQIGSDLLALEWNFVSIAPFFGYCMYVCASIHIATLGKKSISDDTERKLMTNLAILKLMKPYWTSLERLVSTKLAVSLASRLTNLVDSSSFTVSSA